MFVRNLAAWHTARIAALALLTLHWLGSPAFASIGLPPLQQLGDDSLEAQQKQLEALLKHSGNDPYIVEELGRIAYQRSNPTLAKELWDRAAKQDPNIASAAVQLVFADIAAGQLESAQKRLDALNVASTKDAHVVIAAGELAMVRRDFKSAHELLQRALDMAPQYTATQLSLGHLMERANQLDEARTFYKKAAELQPNRDPGWLRLAAINFQQGRAKDALDAYRQAEKCRGNQPLAETRLGEAYYLRGDLFSAYQLYQSALERKSDDPFPRLRLAQILERTGHSRESQAQLEQIVKTREYPEALKVLGESQLKAGNLDGAVTYYRRAIKAKPEDWIVANNLALLLVQTKGPADEAVNLIDQAIQTVPQPPPALEGTKGCVLWYAGRANDAEPLLKSAIAALPSHSWTRYCYGQVLLAQQKPAEAREQFQACQFLEPTFLRRDEVVQILSKLDKEGHNRSEPEWKRESQPPKPTPATEEPDKSRSVLKAGSSK